MLLQNCHFARRLSLVKIQPPVADVISSVSGEVGERTERNKMSLREKKNKTLIEMGSILILENVFLTDCCSPLPPGF